MIENDLDKVLNYMKRYVENVYEHDSEIMLNWKDIKLVLEEIERLNNIINELEEEYINYMDKQDFAKKCKISRPYLDKLLKGMNRKEIYEFCKQRNKFKELKGKE